MKILRYIIVLVAICFSGMAYGATPQQSFDKCVATLRNAASITAEFSMSGAGHSLNGSLSSKGRKFAIVSSSQSTWYDGSDIWVYSANSGEATVWKPSNSELAESNPLLYLSSASDYTVENAPGAKSGEVMLMLKPKKRGSGVKSIKVTLNCATNLPKALDIATGSGNFKVTIRNLRLNAAVSDASFRFPKSKYPKAKVTDLR